MTNGWGVDRVRGEKKIVSSLNMHGNLWGSTLTLALSRPEGEGI